jgi:hypothetical protein
VTALAGVCESFLFAKEEDGSGDRSNQVLGMMSSLERWQERNLMMGWNWKDEMGGFYVTLYSLL